jgi:hydroxyacylglutathione hydrolase
MTTGHERTTMRRTFRLLTLSVLLTIGAKAWCDPVPGTLNVHWIEGAEDCVKAALPPLQVHAYESQTFILRQGLCASFEGNFLYLLIGNDRALLIDTGAISDAATMPLAKTVQELLPENGGAKLPLTVVHTHQHRDHYDGDTLLAALPAVRIAPPEGDRAQNFLGFKQWPTDIVQLDLGSRIVDIIATPGHTPDHVSFYDERTALLFSGDFLLPGRLTINDARAYRESADRVLAFLESHRLIFILGGHIELDASGNVFDDGSHYHPNEHVLQLSKETLLQLPAALRDFNGFYSRQQNFILTNPIHNLIAVAGAAVLLLAAIVWGVRAMLRRRKTAS